MRLTIAGLVAALLLLPTLPRPAAAGPSVQVAPATDFSAAKKKKAKKKAKKHKAAKVEYMRAAPSK